LWNKFYASLWKVTKIRNIYSKVPHTPANAISEDTVLINISDLILDRFYFNIYFHDDISDLARQPRKHGLWAVPKFPNGSEQTENVEGQFCMGQKEESRTTGFGKI
jgi:hypothetical protein